MTSLIMNKLKANLWKGIGVNPSPGQQESWHACKFQAQLSLFDFSASPQQGLGHGVGLH